MAVSRKCPITVPLASAYLRHIESALSRLRPLLHIACNPRATNAAAVFFDIPPVSSRTRKKCARTITTSGSPLIARRSDSVGVIVAELSWLDPSSSDP